MGQKRRLELLPATSGLRRTTDIIRPARWGPVRANKRPCINRTGTNEVTNRHNLPAQRFTAVGELILQEPRGASPAFPLGLERRSKINAQSPRAESAQSVLSTGLAAVTTSSKFKVRKFWRGAMRPLAPARSGDARGRVLPCGLGANFLMRRKEIHRSRRHPKGSCRFAKLSMLFGEFSPPPAPAVNTPDWPSSSIGASRRSRTGAGFPSRRSAISRMAARSPSSANVANLCAILRRRSGPPRRAIRCAAT